MGCRIVGVLPTPSSSLMGEGDSRANRASQPRFPTPASLLVGEGDYSAMQLRDALANESDSPTGKPAGVLDG